MESFHIQIKGVVLLAINHLLFLKSIEGLCTITLSKSILVPDNTHRLYFIYSYYYKTLKTILYIIFILNSIISNRLKHTIT